jgi:hypothetical protein
MRKRRCSSCASEPYCPGCMTEPEPCARCGCGARKLLCGECRVLPPAKRPIRKGGPRRHEIVVEDTTEWEHDPARLHQAIAGLLAAIQRITPDGLTAADRIATHVDVGVGPVQFALYAIGAHDAASDAGIARVARGEAKWLN